MAQNDKTADREGRLTAGAADGEFHYSLAFVGGETLELFGRATCMTVEAERGRAWIGGVIPAGGHRGGAGGPPVLEDAMLVHLIRSVVAISDVSRWMPA